MALPVTAQASCPVQADLFIGIVLVQNDRFVSSTFQNTNMGLIENRRAKQGQAFLDTLTIYAHPLAAQFLEFPNADLNARFAYRGELSALDRLDEIGAISMPMGAWIGSGSETKGVFRARFTGESETTITECRYRTWDVITEISIEGFAPVRRAVKFAPDLGVALNPARIDANGDVLSEITYNWIGTEDDIRR